MENFTLNTIVSLAAANNIEKITAEYIPTKKNSIVKDHYKNLNFETLGDLWTLDLAGYKNRNMFICVKGK